MAQVLQRQDAQGRPKPQEADFSGLMDVADYLVDLSDYREIGPLGSGAFGKIWKGQSRVTGWIVAVKELFVTRLDGQDLEFYRREVQILFRCKDPFLLDFVGFTMTPPYSVVTSFMPCGTLWDALHNKEYALNGAQKTNIAMGMAHGMMYLHRHKIVHRDLKSPNILLDDRLLPKIADFGLSRFVSESDAIERLTGNIGTPIWMAPEVLMDTPYGPPVDVYAYGMILYEMYAEKVPFGGVDRMRIFKAVVEDGQRPQLPNPELPIAQLITRCWDTDPARRPSFEDIYAQFVSQAISFPMTKPEGTALLVHEVHGDEQIVDTAVLDFADRVNKMLQLRKQRREPAELQMELTLAAGAGNLDRVDALLTAYVHIIDINGRDSNGVPALHAAVQAGALVVVEYITHLERADKNVRDAELNTPLITAVKNGHPRIVGFLAQCKGVDVNAQNCYGWTALHVVALLDESWHTPMFATLGLAKDVRTDIVDWEGKKPFWNNPQAVDDFVAKQDAASGKKY